jgi:hypothetical protein
LLVTRNLSSLVVDQLLERNIEFIDVDGNIYLNSSDIYIAVRNQTSKETTNKSLEITATALQLIYFILKDPSIIAITSNENYWKLNSHLVDGITPKVIKNTLEKLDYIKRTREGYEIIDYVRPVGKQKYCIEALSHLFLHFNPLVNTKAISSIKLNHNQGLISVIIIPIPHKKDDKYRKDSKTR